MRHRPALRALLVGLLLAAPAAAHGGQYRGPAPTPASGAPGPTSGDGPSSTPDDAAWSRWWDFNREPYLELKTAVQDRGATTGGDGEFFLGHGGGLARRNALRPDSAVVHGQVVPALVALLERQRDVDIISACLLALAKIGDAPDDDVDLVAVLEPWLAHANQEVQETAAVALGVLGNMAAGPLLAALARDEAEGRKAVGGGRVALRTRAFATYGLGLLGARATRLTERRFVVLHLTEILESDDAARPDVATAAILSLGLVPLDDGDLPELDERGRGPEGLRPTASRQAQVQWLLERLDDSQLKREVRAFVPVALARLDAGAFPSSKTRIVDVLVPIARGDVRVELQVRHGAVHALGLIGDDDEDLSDKRVRAALVHATSEADRIARYVALVSLGRVGARQGAGLRGAARQELRSLLGKLLVRGQSAQRPWAALALGLLEQGAVAEGEAPSVGLRLTLRERFAAASSPSERGALMTALGLVGDQEAGPALVERLGNGDWEQRSQAAVALGMMRYEPAIPALMELVGKGTYQPGTLRDAAIALALMRHKPVAGLLLGYLGGSPYLVVRAAAARALAYVGDGTVVAPLLELVGRRRLDDSTRAFAVVALGLVCDKDPFPWNSRLAQDLGWFETPPTLHDPAAQKGVIDLF